MSDLVMFSLRIMTKQEKKRFNDYWHKRKTWICLAYEITKWKKYLHKNALGQGYENRGKMARAYNDEQAIISLNNDYAKYMPYSTQCWFNSLQCCFCDQRMNTKEKVETNILKVRVYKVFWIK